MTFEPWNSTNRVLTHPAPADDEWADYFDQLFPVRSATPWDSFKIDTVGRNHAHRLWDRRAELLEAWCVEHGDDPGEWPERHPPAVLYVPSAYHAACLGCTWLRDAPSKHAAQRAADTHADQPE